MRSRSLLSRLALLLAFAPLAALAQDATGGTTTVIVVRHAEKATEPAADPPLTSAGAARADALYDLVRDAGISAIVSTQFQRTRQTVAPTAAKLGITSEIVDARLPQHPRLVADSVLAKYRGRTVLVVGHSNTVGAIVAALGAPLPANICDGEYDNAFIVKVPASGQASVTRLHYGAVSPPDASCRAMK